MAMRVLWSLCLLLCFLIDACRSESRALQKVDAGAGAGAAAENARAPPGAARALSAPSVAHDGRIVACSGKDLLGFEPNGSFAWIVPLGHLCNDSIGPVFEGEQVYLVAEYKVIKVTPQNVHTAEPALEVFFSHNATAGRSEEIIGMSISGSYWSLFITIRNRGLFAFSLRGELKWSVGPVIDLLDYHLGCKRNVSGCYFDSAPVLDQCEGALYITNTEGQLYSLYIDSCGIRWIQDLSSHGKVMTIAPGNSGCLYIVFPRKSIVVGIDVSTGTISWKQNIGPISNEKNLPTVDYNGWMSIGSLDGILYSVSPDGDMRKFLGKTANDSVIHVGPILDCSGFSIYVAKTIVEGRLIQTTGEDTYVSAKKPSLILFTLLAPANETIYWTGEYPGELSNLLSSSDLNDFTIDETVVLTLLSAARIGNTMQCYTRRKKTAWTCRQAIAIFAQADPGEPSYLPLLLFLLVVIVIQVVAILFCCIFWTKKRIQGNGLQKFLEKRRSLHSKRRILGKKILELEQKAAEDASSNEALGQLGEMVKAKEGVERKLYGSYSLGRDKPAGLKQQGSSSLPIYHGEYKSHSFHSSQKESITIFNMLSDTDASTSEDGTSSYSDDSESCSGTSSGEVELDVRPMSGEEAGPSNTANVGEAGQHELEKQHQHCSA